MFYPIFLFILLEIVSFRIDLILTFFISVILTFMKFDELIHWISKKLDKRCIGEKAISWGLVATGALEI